MRAISYKTSADCLLIDAVTLKHLEVVEAMDGGRDGTLLHEIDRTVTPMAGRLLRSWLLRPLVSLDRIRDRLDAVEEFAFRSTDRGKFRDVLKAVHDLERLIARTALGSAGPRDLVALKQSIAAVPRARMTLEACEAPLTRALLGSLDDLADVRDDIDRSAHRRARARSSGTVDISATAWTPRSTNCGASAARASRSSPSSRSASAREPASTR